MTETEALSKAIEKAGGHRKLGDFLGIKRTAIYQWKIAPIKRVPGIEAATNGEITRYDLRPDFFGAPPSVSSKRRKSQ